MEKKEVEVVLFGTDNKDDIKRVYPELSKIDEFKDLGPSKVKFCWLVGNVTSPIFRLDRWERIRQALQIVWGSSYRTNPNIKDIANAKHEDDIPDEILKAIYKMNTFDPSYRLKAKLINEYIFDTLNQLIVVDATTLAAMDVDDKKKYADLSIKVSSELQGMIDRIEGSYGIKTINRKTKKEVKIDMSNLF